MSAGHTSSLSLIQNLIFSPTIAASEDSLFSTWILRDHAHHFQISYFTLTNKICVPQCVRIWRANFLFGTVSRVVPLETCLDSERSKFRSDEATANYSLILGELRMAFEDTYVSLIRAIGTLAYPKYSTPAVNSAHGTVAGFPIFIMRPFREQLEQGAHSVVDRLRLEGDSASFWLDTSGWLNIDVDFNGPADDQDFFLDDIVLYLQFFNSVLIIIQKDLLSNSV